MTNLELFNYIKSLLKGLADMRLFFDMQNFNRGERLFERWSKDYGMILTEVISKRVEINADSIAVSGVEAVNENVIMSELQGLLAAMEQKDYVLMSDLLQLQIKPFLQSLVLPVSDLARGELQGKEEAEAQLLNITGYEYEDNGRIYRVEPTASGMLTLSVTDKAGTYYMHSNDNPMAATSLMINQYYDVNAERYIVFGLGLGYHVLSLCEACHGLVPIDVYESDEVVIELARRTSSFAPFEGESLSIIYDPDLTKFSEAATSGTIIIHYPSIRNIQNVALRDRMNQIFVQDSSVRNQIGDMLANYRYNISHIEKSADAIRHEIEGRDVILVAAGPSLDNNIDNLKKIYDLNIKGELEKTSSSKKVIICVGTAFKKLMNAGIKPDYVAFLDSAGRLRAQIRGLEDADVPLLMASTATLYITRDYAGEKYLICQRGMDEAELYANEHGYTIFETGGSVSTVIMDVAVRLGASRVIAVGLDLAYTNNKYHADGAGRSTSIESLEGLVEVKSGDGNTLYTTVAMDMYREWFEDYIKRHAHSGVEFINATEGGAKICGMKEMPLNSVIDD